MEKVPSSKQIELFGRLNNNIFCKVIIRGVSGIANKSAYDHTLSWYITFFITAYNFCL